MKSLIYKTLFEVKLMHEYFLTDSEGTTVFDSGDQRGRIRFLLNEYKNARESIDRDLNFEFPEEFKTEYTGYGLKLLQTYSGFKVSIRVTQKNQSDNTLVYEPFIPLPENLDLYILLSKKNNSIGTYTNSRSSKSISLIYFFSNDNLLDTKTAPYLVNNISLKKSDYVYEQGELASLGVNVIQQNYKDSAGIDQWSPVTGNAFVNENDRLLLPLKFDYSFPEEAKVSQAQFTVKDRNGNEIKKIFITAKDILQKVTLDFSPKPGEQDILSLPETFSFSDFIFSLEVTGSNGFSETQRVIFSNAFYDKARWGVINIRTIVPNTQFSLLAEDGYLIKRRNEFGVWTDSPIFEIPVKSRYSNWRYINDKGNELDLINELRDYLLKEDKILLTQKPRAISKSYFLIQNNAGNATKYLPNPVSYDLKKDDKARLYFDVMVPDSDLFPII